MANPERGEARLQVGDRVFTLRLTVGACCELEDHLGHDFDAITARVRAGRLTDLRGLLWAVLQPYHSAVFAQMQDVSSIIDKIGLWPVRTALRELLELNADDDEAPVEGKGESDSPPGSRWRRLYLDARQHGIPGETFWQLSLRELWREMTAIRQREKAARDARVSQAWLTAALVWQKQLPDLQTLLGSSSIVQQDRPQTWQEMRAIARGIFAAHSEAEERKRAS